VQQLLGEPNDKSPANAAAYKMFTKQKAAYAKCAPPSLALPLYKGWESLMPPPAPLGALAPSPPPLVLTRACPRIPIASSHPTQPGPSRRRQRSMRRWTTTMGEGEGGPKAGAEANCAAVGRPPSRPPPLLACK